jgi:hypothetical protein
MGDTDIVAILDADDEAALAAGTLQLGTQGNIRTRMMRAFSEQRWRHRRQGRLRLSGCAEERQRAAALPVGGARASALGAPGGERLTLGMSLST